MLQKTEKFQNDVKRYNDIIENLSSDKEKLEARRLLNDLIYEVKNMDNMYVDMVYAKQLPSMGNEIKNKITSIRKELEKRLVKN